MAEKYLLVTDLDGTLLTSDRTVSEKTKMALKRLLDAGHEVAVATGRMMGAARIAAYAADLDCYIVATNGMTVQHFRSDKPMFETFMPPYLIQKVLDVVIPTGMSIQVYNDRQMVASPENPYIKKYHREVLALPKSLRFDVIEDGDIRSVADVKKVTMMHFDREVPRDVLDRLAQIPEVEVVRSSNFTLDVTLAGINKGTGLAHLMKLLAVPPERTLAFGDAENDVPMLRAAGWAFAMANASEPPRQVASRMTGSNDEDGLVHGISQVPALRHLVADLV